MDTPSRPVSRCTIQKQSNGCNIADSDFDDSMMVFIASLRSDKDFNWQNEHFWRGNITKAKPSLVGAQSTISIADKSMMSSPSLCSKTTLDTQSDLQDDVLSASQGQSHWGFISADLSLPPLNHTGSSSPAVSTKTKSQIRIGARNEELSKQVVLIRSMRAPAEMSYLHDLILDVDTFLRDPDILKRHVSAKLKPEESEIVEQVRLKREKLGDFHKSGGSNNGDAAFEFGGADERDESVELESDEEDYEVEEEEEEEEEGEEDDQFDDFDEDENDGDGERGGGLPSHCSTASDDTLSHPSNRSFATSFQSGEYSSVLGSHIACASCLGLQGSQAGISPGCLRPDYVQATDSGANSSSSSPSTLSPNSEETGNQPSSVSKRRRHDQDNEGENPEGNDDNQKRPRKTHVGAPANAAPRFACPFQTYHGMSKCNCSLSGFTSFNRVRNHVLDKHCRSQRCQRCWKLVKEDNLAAHEEKGICPEMPCPVEQLLTEEQEVSIRAIKFQGRNLAKWRILFQAIFPDVLVLMPVEEITPFLDYNSPHTCVGLVAKREDTSYRLIQTVPSTSTAATDVQNAPTTLSTSQAVHSSGDMPALGNFDFNFQFTSMPGPCQMTEMFLDSSNMGAQFMQGQAAANANAYSNAGSDNPTPVQQPVASPSTAFDMPMGHKEQRIIDVLQARSKRHRDNANDARASMQMALTYMEKLWGIHDQLFIGAATSDHAMLEEMGNIMEHMAEILQGRGSRNATVE